MRSLKHELSMILRDSDCWYDLVASRRSKRKRMCRHGNAEPNYVDSCCAKESKSVKPGEDMVDYDYKMYLDYMNRVSDCDVDVDGDGDGNGGGGVVNGGGCEDDDADPEYKLFLENLKKDGNSYAFDMTKEDGTRIFIKYEEDDCDLSDRERGSSMPKENVKPEPTNNGFICSEPEPMTSRPFLSDCKPEMISRADESYYAFLSNVQIKGHSLIYESKDCILKYEQDDEMTAESEGLANDGAPSSSRNKIQANANGKANNSYMDEDEDDRDSVQNLSQNEVVSVFEEKLNLELKKPYDQKEFQDLFGAAKIKTNMERSRELRTRSLIYPTKRKGLSYLECHPDLARMIEQALSLNNKHRALFLLRCLFFYLQNLAHEGAFVPWTNPSILEMLSGF